MIPFRAETDAPSRPARPAMLHPATPLAEPPASSQLERLLDPSALTILFQPIFDLRPPAPVPCAVEALTRGPRGSNFEAPDVLFEYARRKRAEGQLDRVVFSAVFTALSELPAGMPVHVNVHASTLSRDLGFAGDLEALAAKHEVALSRLAVEIVEHTDLIDEATYGECIERLRDLGVGIALDDIGRGRSNFQMMLLTRPDVLKIDHYLADGVANDVVRRAVIDKVREISASFGGKLVVEGIERRPDLEALLELGVEFGQGFLLARPQAASEVTRFPVRLDAPTPPRWPVRLSPTLDADLFLAP